MYTRLSGPSGSKARWGYWGCWAESSLDAVKSHSKKRPMWGDVEAVLALKPEVEVGEEEEGAGK